MKNEVHPLEKMLPRLHAANVFLKKPDAAAQYGTQIFFFAIDKIIHDRNRKTTLDKLAYKFGADKSRAARD